STRPSPPVEMGVGDYYKAEFTERGDRDFYLYRLGEIEDSTLIRRQAGVIPMDQNNYALAQNSCYKTQAELPNQATKILTGQELRSSGKLASSQFAHPFSATALTTEGASGKTQISLVLEDQVQSIKTNSTSITVEYLDAGTDQFAVEFVNPQGQVQRETVTKTNTNRWKSYQIIKTTGQISWQHRLPGGADLRLDCLCNSAAGDDIFSMVRLESQGPPMRVAPSNTLSFCGEAVASCTASADVNQDGSVNLLDLTTIIAHFGNSGTSIYDVTCDQVVNLLDFSRVVSRMQF
ncbi:MAG TPA: dockerin type I domain-containing protein, partial [Candidatus Woesebacteria bacterium]|nr:dockerin type I domain-containing protein [Candidatus Woesebacteria bacterium]